jgi:hypothetical protein
MALTVYEYANVTEQGLPIEPPTTRTAAATTPLPLQPSTRYVGVVSTTAVNIRVGGSGSGEDATSADYAIEAAKNYGFAVRQGGKTWVDIT